MERRLAAILAADMVGYSRLMEADEVGVIERQKELRSALIDPEIERNRGTIIKTTGDGLLVEFASAIDAVRAAIEIQTQVTQTEGPRPKEERIRYRFGINVGDIVFDGGDVFGGGVNVASRLETMTEPGGICISDPTYQMIRDSLEEPFNDLGAHKVKNIARAIRVWQWTPDRTATQMESSSESRSQQVQFCLTPDGVQLAYARVGQGPVLLKAPNYLNHLDYEWRTPIWGPFLSCLAEKNELVRFDQRGGGLSDWNVDEFDFDTMVSDIGTVADAAGLGSFSLLGISQGCGFSIGYAVRNPGRVRALVLLGGYTRGLLKRNTPDARELFDASQTMIQRGWGLADPSYRHLFATHFIPGATPEQKAGLDELQRVSVSPQNAARILGLNAETDVGEIASQVSVPTLVLHCEGDQVVPIEEGRRMAALIPGARFVALPGDNHALLENTPAFDDFFREVNAFLGELDL